MERVNFFLNTVLSSFFEKSVFNRNGNKFVEFRPENFNQIDGFQAELFIGKVKFIDKCGDIKYSKSLLIKILCEEVWNKFIENSFTNEIFMYNNVLSFFMKLNDNIENIFPKFFFGSVIFKTSCKGIQVMENLQEDNYVMANCKVFLDLQHLILMAKKLGEFHAYSYQAKKEKHEEFFSIAENFVETNPIIISQKDVLQPLFEFCLEQLSMIEKYRDKVEVIRNLVKHPYYFTVRILEERETPLSVICHGDFLRNNVLFKYDFDNNPVDVKFIDLANARYCSPITDLGLMLYMNADQKMRNEHWDELIDAYYNSLRNTFPCNDLVPQKSEIIAEFKEVILQPFLLVMFFLPLMLAAEEDPSPKWVSKYFEPEHEQYESMNLAAPPFVMKKAFINIVKNSKTPYILNVLGDIIDRNFV